MNWGLKVINQGALWKHVQLEIDILQEPHSDF